jgi:carboxylesterase type B
VYAPTNATSSSKLPVYFFIQGGGFNSNSNANYDGSGLVAASGLELVVVTFNYRVGPYGFIASTEIEKDPSASLNNGLKDQRKALEWVQRHISAFGGDPAHVVLGGDSAGAASIAYHLTAYNGLDQGLFVGAAAESVSFAPILSVSQSQYQYDNLVKLAGCSGTSSTLACLRSKSAAELQTVNRNVPYPGVAHPPLFMWNPVLDGELVPNYTRSAFENGDFVKVCLIAVSSIRLFPWG